MLQLMLLLPLMLELRARCRSRRGVDVDTVRGRVVVRHRVSIHRAKKHAPTESRLRGRRRCPARARLPRGSERTLQEFRSAGRAT